MNVLRGIIGVLIVGALIYGITGDESTKVDTVQSLEEHTASVIAAGEAKTAVGYNDFVIGLEVRIAQRLVAIDKNQESEKHAQFFDDATEEIRTAMEALDAVTPFSGGNTFRDAARENFILHAERIRLLRSDRAREEPIAVMSELLNLKKRMDESNKRFATAQTQFAETHTITLETNLYEVEQSKAKDPPR